MDVRNSNSLLLVILNISIEIMNRLDIIINEFLLPIISPIKPESNTSSADEIVAMKKYAPTRVAEKPTACRYRGIMNVK
jgi:hypothetical protein